MTDSMRTRVTLKDGIADIRVLANHPMETGFRPGDGGRPVPAHYIQELVLRLNGRIVIENQISQAVSRNPVFSFRMQDVKAGDRIEISWLDNRGERDRTEVIAG